MDIPINGCNVFGISITEHTLLDHNRKVQACKHPCLLVILLSKDLTESGLYWEVEQGNRKTHSAISGVSSPELPYKQSLIPNAHSREKRECLVAFLKQPVGHMGLLWIGREKWGTRHLGLSHSCSNASSGPPPGLLYFNSAAKSERKVTENIWQSSCIKGDHNSTIWPSNTSILRSFPFPSPFQGSCQKMSQRTHKRDMANKFVELLN